MINLRKNKNVVVLFISIFLFGIFLMFADKFHLDSTDKHTVENKSEEIKKKIMKIQNKNLQKYYQM